MKFSFFTYVCNPLKTNKIHISIRMKNITLISDWKLRDPYVAMFKGQLLKAIPDANIIDISHAIECFNVAQTAFILKNSYSSFPENTIHIILTGTSLSHKSMPVVVKFDNQFFIGEDNGIFSLMFGDDDQPEAFVYNQTDENSNILDKCILMAKAILSDKLKKVVDPYPQWVKKLQFMPDHNEQNRLITGQIAYIDSCCNAITNIPIDMFRKIVKGGSFTVNFSMSKHIKVTHYQDFYNPNEHEVYMIGNRLGFLELTINRGHLAVLADLNVGDKIEIRY